MAANTTMSSSVNIRPFNVQHKNKCYCQNGKFCYCTGIDSSKNSRRSPHKFIKIRSDKDKQQSKSNSLTTTSSFSPALTSTNNSTSVSSLTNTIGVRSPEPKLTGRRELYERSKLEGTDFNQKFDVRTWNASEQTRFLSGGVPQSDLFSDELIAKLQEFRLQNPEECLSSCNRFSVNKKKKHLVDDSKQSMEETKYTLSSRGLLKKIGDNDDGRAAIVITKSAVKDILRQKLKLTKDKDKFIRKTTYIPDNSLALRYQKTY